jgi:uncharacterized iron-regulated membrane protein
MSRTVRRWWFLTHRWAGIFLCLLMVMWFVSGVVMMYVGYPKLSAQERLERLPALLESLPAQAAEQCCRWPALNETPRSVRLTTIAGQLRLLIEPAKGPARVWDPLAGAFLSAPNQQTILNSARGFANSEAVRLLGQIQEDAWTHSRALDPHRPLWLAEVRDGSDLHLYLSSKTGEVVRDATAQERTWNWVGAWIHWLYPFRGNRFDKAWHDIVVWLSVAGTVLAVSGLVIGLMRWRFGGRYKSGSHSPYRGLIARWHHILGLSAGLLTITWIFSGLMSMNPWKVFDSGAPSLNLPAYDGGPLRFDTPHQALGAVLQSFYSAGLPVRELQWRVVAGKLHVVGLGASAPAALLPADGSGPVLHRVEPGLLETRAALLVPHAKPLSLEWITKYDTYYYSRAAHSMLGHVEKPLPVLRVKFDDPHASWVHIDAATGQVLNRIDQKSRVKRWLFAFLHSFDWWPLLALRPLWDVLLIAGSILGLLISLTGVILGARRLMK